MKHLLFIPLLLCAACNGPRDDRAIIYSNADEEAIAAMTAALDANGFEGRYLIQPFATSELGGRLLAEGKGIEADIVTMSTYFIDTARERNAMFHPAYPLTGQEGAIAVNPIALEKAGLPQPASLKDLADPIYENQLSVTDISSSSTGWLLVQTILGAYPEDEARRILAGIIRNARNNLEHAGTGPLKKTRTGETAIAFALRHQIARDPMLRCIDPAEGRFMLTESIAAVDKGANEKPGMQAIVDCIRQHARPGILRIYPRPLYPGEGENPPGARLFPQPLTTDLLRQHQRFFEACK